VEVDEADMLRDECWSLEQARVTQDGVIEGMRYELEELTSRIDEQNVALVEKDEQISVMKVVLPTHSDHRDYLGQGPENIATL
jgi:hypothetical protein